MRQIFTILTVVFFMSSAFAQGNNSREELLSSIHQFCKSELPDDIWIDYDECNQNSLTIYQGNTAYMVKLSSIKSVHVETIEKRKKTLYKLVIETFPAAKIKSESEESTSWLFIQGIGMIESANGLGFIDSMNVYGDKEKLEELNKKFQSLIEM